MNQTVIRLLQQVAARQRLASLGRWFYLLTLWLAGAFAVVLIFARISSLIPDWYTLPSLLVILALALLIALVLQRKPTLSQTARMVDTRTGAKDVFLTAAMIENAPGEYKPLVLEEAARRANAIRAETVVPFHFWPSAGRVGAVLLALLVAILIFPRFDPFGHQKKLDKEKEKQQLLEQSVKEVVQRTKVLESQPLDAEHSEAVDEALKEVKQTFDQMKPNDRANNLKQLNQAQQQVGEMWKKAEEQKLKDSLDRSPVDQKFGSPESEKAKQWEKEFKEGKTDSLQKEAKALQEMAQKMQTETDPTAKAQQRQELQQRLQEMSDFAHSHAGKESLNDALSKAQQQMNDANHAPVSEEPIAAVAKSMSLTEKELKALSQSLRDQQALAAALDALDAGKSANGTGTQFNPQASATCKTMGDYAKYFSSIAGKAGSGLGPPQAGKGSNSPTQSWGERPRGDPNAKVGFKTEKDNSQLTAGKTLLQWNEKGLSENGTASKDYAQSVKTLKEGVSEAILKEEIPPGYHDQIQKYFNDMEKVAGKAPGATGAGGTSGGASGSTSGGGTAAPAPAPTPPAAPADTTTH